MSEVVGEGVIRIRTDETGMDVNASGKRAGKGYVSGFGSSLKSLAGVMLGALAVSKGLDFVKQGVTDARAYNKAYAATEAIIKSTGGAANVTAKQVGELSGALEAKTGVDDEVIQRGANLLLTFKNVRNEVGKGADIFNRANAAAIDLSAAGFGAVEGQAKMLGKALNDPIAGISALGRSGVTFSEEQKGTIKSLVETGKILEAQKIILGEVESQVGGTAEAQLTAADKASIGWDNLRQRVGESLIPVIDTLATVFADKVVPALEDTLDWLGTLGPVFSSIGGIIGSVFGSGSGGAGGALSSFFSSVKSAVEEVLPVMRDTFVNQILPALQSLGSYLITNLWPVFKQIVGVIATEVIPTVVILAKWIYGTLYPAVVRIVTAVGQNLKPVFDQLVATFKADVLPTLKDLIVTIREDLIPALKPVIERIVEVTGKVLAFAAAILGKVLPPLIRLSGFIISNVVPVLAAIIVKVVQVIGWILDLGQAFSGAVQKVIGFQTSLVRLVVGGISAVVSAVAGLPGKVLAMGGRLFEAGKSIISQFVAGIKGAGGVVSDIAGNVWDVLKGLLNGAIDKINSALEFTIGLPGPDIHVNPGNIPHLAKGTDYFQGGVALVGEQGRELVTLPRGSRVTPHAETERILAGSGGGRGIVVNNYYPKPEKPSTAVARLNTIGYLLGA